METVTIIMPISRPDHLRRIFAQLDLMPCNRETTNIVTMVDGNQQLLELARKFTENSKFNQKICVYRAKGVPNVSSVKGRRGRIAEIHNEIRQIVKNIPCDYIFSLEDDTLITLNTLNQLLMNYIEHPHAGFVTGLELGRWGWTSVGVYKANDIYNPTILESLDPKLTRVAERIPLMDLMEIDAAGLYGCLIKKDNYINHEFKPFMGGALGPDVDFGIAMRQQGFRNYANLTLKFTHLTKQEPISFDGQVVRVRVSLEGEIWKQEII